MANVIKATQTLNLINSILEQDQGASFRGWLGKVIPHMGDAYSTKSDPFRPHLGASVLGGECARKIWYGFNWATRKQHGGRLLRLFNRGHLEEARFIALLLMIGCQIYQQDAEGKQYRISFGDGHGGGSGDGIAIGVPDLPSGFPCVTEFKTHNAASFKKLTTEGVRSAKFEHFVQMQLYMFKMGIGAALYMAVNKDNDDIYAEIIYLDSAMAQQYIDRGTNIIWLEKPPQRVSKSPGFFQCKWCDDIGVCHKGEPTDVNCRTCVHVTKGKEGKWFCAYDRANLVELAREHQFAGCARYAMNKVFHD